MGRIIDHSGTEPDSETEEEMLTETEMILDDTTELNSETEQSSENALGLEADSATADSEPDPESVIEVEPELESEERPESASESAPETGDTAILGLESSSASEDATGAVADESGDDSGTQEVMQESSEGKTEEADTAQSEQLEEMEAYVEIFQPEISVMDGAADSFTDFLDGRETQFLTAVGEYVYSLYGNQVSISKIEIVENVRNNDEECSCQIELFTEDDDSELFICSYNKKWDYYGVYSLYSEN
ncbi:MAG: hypothetical protein LUG99_04605 [Lachnospiraceae bacterium]|nr:hypothetical protein [Lachnospiraceae bacterium]